MQIRLANFINHTPEGAAATAILRKCVHCGFCLASCPTYRLLGDELDGPRGRIYLIKQTLEGEIPTEKTQLHLDRCLTCRACETACPSGVDYGRLLDIGRHVVATRTPRNLYERLKRRLLRSILANRTVFGILLRLARGLRPLLPRTLRRKIPLSTAGIKPWPSAVHLRRMLLLDGCVQTSLSPNTNAAAARILDRIGITLMRAQESGCCGAISYHLDAPHEGLDYMRRNIDAWWPYVEQGVEAIIITASGCGVMVADYDRLLVNDPTYAAKARRISELAKDIGEIIAAEKEALKRIAAPQRTGRRVAFHPPCTLQHGLKLNQQVEALLCDFGFELTAVPNAHLCCGSAGTYSILQRKLATQLLQTKIAALESGDPSVIVTANIGCQSHLQTMTDLKVVHWIEELDARLN